MNKVLIVDSDKENLQQIQTGFAKSEQYQLITASNAKTAVDILNKTEIAALVSGMKLFGFSGIELIAYMTRMFPSTPCIAMLDPDQPAPYFPRSSKSLPALQFIEKPVDHKKLDYMIASGIKQKNKSGSNNIIYIENFLPLIFINRRTCQVDIKTDQKKKGSFYFAQGELIDACWGKKTGENAVFEMLSWERVKITVSTLTLHKKEEKINFDLMEKIGVSWDKRDEPIQVSDEPIQVSDDAIHVSDEPIQISDEAIQISDEMFEDTLPHADVIAQLEQSLEKNINFLKTVKGYQGIAILTPKGKLIVSDVMDDLIDFDKFSADFAAVFDQGNKAASKHNFECCTSVNMLTPKGLLIIIKSDDYEHGSYCFMVLMTPDGNGFFIQTQLAKLIPRILNF